MRTRAKRCEAASTRLQMVGARAVHMDHLSQHATAQIPSQQHVSISGRLLLGLSQQSSALNFSVALPW